MGLERPRRLLAELGDPQTRFPAVLIAGTNGKGSTAALLASMTRAAGLTTGLFTSPALGRVEEQIRLDDVPVPAGLLAGLLEQTIEAAQSALGGEPTPFEALTAAACLAFASTGVELAVLEAGMGGARDATNVVEPEISVLTSVGIEHRGYLGDTLEAIAREKAGIFRRDRPALVGPLDPGVLEVVAEEAAHRGAELHAVADEVRLSSALQRVALTTPVRSYQVDLALAGAHQAWNLALAVRAAELLAERGWGGLGKEAITRGAAECRVPGRLETVELPQGPPILLDVAHNPQAVEALVRHLREVASPYRPWDLLFGVLADKQAEAMLPPLAAGARRVVLTRPTDPRGRDPQELLSLLPTRYEAEVEVDPVRALERLLGENREGDPEEDRTLRVVCGSMVLVGEVRGLLSGTPGSDILTEDA